MMSDPAYRPGEPAADPPPADPAYRAPVRDPAYGGPAYPAGYAPAPARRTRGWGSLAIRIVFSLLGAAGMIVGAFLVWIREASAKGIDISDRAFIQTNINLHADFVKSVGFAFIVLGLIAIVGLAPRSGWLTSLAGAVGIAGFVLLAIQLQRAPGTSFPKSVGVGAWIALAGGIVALIGGFFGSRARVVAYEAVPPAAGPPPAVVE
jgi:hypothetical protein